MKKGSFIVIEGTDGSGKATQLNLLYKRLRKIISKILLVVFLDVPPDISKKLNLQKTERLYLKGRKRDLAERSWRHQELAYKEYLRTVNNNAWWVNVRCTSRGNINSINTIHESVWNVVSKKLDLDKR